MSSDAPTRRARSGRRPRGRHAFAVGLTATTVGLVLLAIAGAAAAAAQGPRVTAVDVDPAAAVQSSGSRLIVTTNQPLEQVDASQVTVTPAAPFAVDTSGRSVGVRFGLPLWDDVEYTVRIDGLRAVGGGPQVRVTETFRTPATELFLLQRGTDEDTIFRTDLGGEEAVPVLRHPHIEDFRATTSSLVASVRTPDDEAALIVTDLNGADARELALPGDGYISNLQASDRGDLVGYTFSDRDLGEDRGRASMLFISSLRDPAAPPVAVEPSGADPRVSAWRFVPDTDRVLLLSFDGSLLLTDRAAEQTTALGNAIAIDGIARGSSDAIVERVDGIKVIDLTVGAEASLVTPGLTVGLFGSATPLSTGATVRTAAVVEDGEPTGAIVIARVGTDGETTILARLSAQDAVLQTCVSPSERYVAVQVAPDAVANAYDTYQRPLPERVETRILTLEDGAKVVTLAGSTVSWCQVPG